MATIQTVTTQGATLQIFGSLTVAELTSTWWAAHPGAIVFPTDENKVYFGGVAYDGLNDTGLTEALSNYYTKTEVDDFLANKQDKLTQGTGIAISGTTIAAVPSQIVTEALVNPIIADNTLIKQIQSTANNASTKADTNAETIATVSDTLTKSIGNIQGDNATVKVTQTTDSTTGVTTTVISSLLDLTLYKIVDTLPSSNPDSSKIYLVKSAESETTNIYEEYIWTGSSFEKLGEYKTEIDLTPYLTKTDAEDIYLKSANISGVTAANNNGTQVSVVTTPDGKAEKVQITAAILIQ